LSAEQRHQLGIQDNLLRLSVGIEDADDLIADLHSAIATITQLVKSGFGRLKFFGKSD
jgi:cystathionine beta-lyase/cystathionine gamma-synthase